MRIIFLVFFLLFVGCSSRPMVTIKAIKASKVTNPAIRDIAVLPFKNDEVSQAQQIEAKLDNAYINGKKYFNVVDRENLKQLLKEQKLNDSGLVNAKKILKLGINQIQSIVVGKVLVNSQTPTRFTEKRVDRSTCAQYRYVNTKRGSYKYCVKYRTYTVSCQGKEYHLKTQIKVLAIEGGNLIFANTYSKSSFEKHCSDDSFTLPDKITENTRLASYIAQDFVNDIAPHYVYFSTYLLDDLDVDTNEDLFEASLKLIKANRIKKANKILLKLYKSSKPSYVISYDLALTYEALGNLEKALSLYEQAEDIAITQGEVLQDIEKAINRVKKNIQELKKARKQI